MYSVKTREERKKVWDPGIGTSAQKTGRKGIPWVRANRVLGGQLCLGAENSQTRSAGSQKALGYEGVCPQENK